MTEIARTRMSRRRLQRLALALPAPLALAALAGRTAGIALAQSDDPAAIAGAEATAVLAPTPACDDGDDLEETIDQTEGPYFTPDSPERTSLLEDHMLGTPLVVAGYVYSTDCRPIAGALIDVWQADDPIFDPSLVIDMAEREDGAGRQGFFTFVLDVA